MFRLLCFTIYANIRLDKAKIRSYNKEKPPRPYLFKFPFCISWVYCNQINQRRLIVNSRSSFPNMNRDTAGLFPESWS